MSDSLFLILGAVDSEKNGKKGKNTSNQSSIHCSKEYLNRWIKNVKEQLTTIFLYTLKCWGAYVCKYKETILLFLKLSGIFITCIIKCCKNAKCHPHQRIVMFNRRDRREAYIFRVGTKTYLTLKLASGLQGLARAEVQPQVGAGQEGQPGDELREGAEEDVRAARLRLRARWADRRKEDGSRNKTLFRNWQNSTS
jgi:hypothetical protein